MAIFRSTLVLLLILFCLTTFEVHNFCLYFSMNHLLRLILNSYVFDQ